MLPDVVRNQAQAFGAGDWVRELPDLVASLAADWGLTIGATYGDATEAYVAEAWLDDGTPAALKVLVPRGTAAAADEITVLTLAGGDGCVRLLRSDAGRGALLLERLGRSLHQLDVPVSRQLEVLVDAAARVWRPAPDCGLRTGAEKGRWLIASITSLWEELDRPCLARTVDDAVACAERRIAAHDDERARLVHGDVHQWNALEAGDGSFKLVDPDGLLADPEYDLGILMRENPVDLLDGDPRRRSRWLARASGLDETAIWEWGVVERVSTGLLGVQVGLEPVASQMLATADAVSGSPA